MLTLVKIRAKYLSKHICAVCFTYLLVPTIMLISIIGANFYQNNEYKDKDKGEGGILFSNIKLFEQNDFSNFRDKFIIVTEDIEDCNILNSLVQEFSFTCETSEENINLKENNKNILKIIKKNGKYKIELIESDNYAFISKKVLNYEKDADPFHQEDLKYDLNSNIKPFLNLQSFFVRFLLIKEKKDLNKDITITYGQNSFPPNTGYYNYMMGPTTSLGIIICLHFSMSTYFFNMRMIDEKEKKLTDLLERQGVSKKNYFFSWLLSFIVLALYPFLVFVIFYVGYFHYHPILFTFNLIMFICCLFPFAYFLYTCISKSKTGSIVIKFINFTSAILGSPITFPQCSKITKIILAFIPQVNFYLCSNSIDKLQTFSNVSWEKMWLKANRVPFMESIIMYLVQIIFYSLLSIFVNNYKNSGLTFFLFLKSLFTKVSRKFENQINNENNQNIQILPYEKYFQELSPINQQRKAQNDCLSIVNITKKFDKLKAVDNFNCDLFGNQIFCLLGHNGAGKSTLINMLSGIYDPTYGDIFYKGRSVVTDKNYLFENIGLCQQEDIFFEYLTVSEHLSLMCEIKGSKANRNEIRELILKIGLAEKTNSECSSLSGGQKRKLCTALALIGNSNIILLDEPTSGMDPFSKKGLWDFLRNYQKNKIILITTHSLDEAEYLGDRIGIMSDGQFICCGTSSFLKSKYPCGFNINLLINSKKFNEEKKNRIFEKIKTYDPQAQIKIASKCIFSINLQTNNDKIGEIFNYIEQSKHEFDIEDYTVASTSLEDVFLKINQKSDLFDIKDNSPNLNNQQINFPNLVGMADCCSQLISQLQRNCLPIRRNFSLVLLEYFSGLGIIYIFAFLFSSLIFGITIIKQDLIGLLEENKIYIYESMNDYLKNSYVYKSTSFITLKQLSREPSDLKDLITMSYEASLANIAKSSIYLKKDGNNLIAYASQLNNGYILANTMFIVSAFLKNEYDIDAAILSTIEYRKEMSIGDEQNINDDTISVLIIICFGSAFGFVIYLGGLINEKIKERKTNIKHLLYLSGSNSWSYWIAFLIIDYIKLIVFTILLIIPIFYVNSSGGYYFLLNMLVINLSSLIFIYFISFFGSRADSGVKFLFILLLSFIIGLIVFFILLIFSSVFNKKVIQYVLNSFGSSYNFTIFDLTPVTSMLLSFGRLLYGIVNFEGQPFYKFGPATYLTTSYMVQFINLFVYSVLLILMESGHLRKFFNFLKLKFCISEHNFVFAKEQLSDEFLIFNNVNNPELLANQLESNQTEISPNNYLNIPVNGANNNNNNNNVISNNNNQNAVYMNSLINNMNNNQPIINANNNNQNINNTNYMNQPIYENNDFMNMPIYGNNLDNLNLPVYDNINDNNIIINSNTNNNSNLVINNSVNNSLNQPLINNSNNEINNNNNNKKIDSIDNAINEMALPETNTTFNKRKGNPYVNMEKDNLERRNDYTTRIEGLRKTFFLCCKKNVRAVDNLYLGLESNEKFGLLGFNGSGKTTTFKAITNEILYDYGKITLFGFDNQKEFEQIRSRIGYCPQENPLFEFMKVREILEFYSDLKTSNVPYQVICEKFGLTKYLETYCINLSGGNKRKLTFAIAIMNQPTLLLLDEPSTGVDPDSKRYMWKNINELTNSGHQYNMILTTHSMEEAEILCDRVSWLKRGNFVCIGNPEKLKMHYSQGYKLHIKFEDNITEYFGEGNNMQGSLQVISGLVNRFNNYFMYFSNNPGLEPYISALIEVINKLKSNTKNITLIEIGKDLSFKLILSIDNDKKKFLFTDLFNMKNNKKYIGEMIISMESLENILTSFS